MESACRTCETSAHLDFFVVQSIVFVYNYLATLPFLVMVISSLLMGLGDSVGNSSVGGRASRCPRSTAKSEGTPAKFAWSARLNQSRGVIAPTDQKSAEVLVPCRNSVDVEVFEDTPAGNVEVNMRFAGIRYRLTAAGTTVILARNAARERVLVVGGPNWNDLNVLEYMQEKLPGGPAFRRLARGRAIL